MAASETKRQSLPDPLNRREFLKVVSTGAAGAIFTPFNRLFQLPDFPNYERLGRVCAGKVELRARPNIDSQEVGVLYEDAVVPWLKEVVGSRPLWYSQRWVETPDGYIYSPNLQPVRNLPNAPLNVLPDPAGMWAEVTVPYADLVLENPPARAPWLKAAVSPRAYYSQIFWVDGLKKDEQGKTWYHIVEKHGTYGDKFWISAEAMRPINADEMSPISPDAAEKRVLVNVTYQTMACFEGNSEVFFCRVSTGAKFDAEGNPVDKWSTPVGKHQIWRKLVSIHMSGGTTGGGYDLPGIGWTTLFSGDGVAVHSTFWHNNFGVPMSHGCVNARPDDAKFVFRWTTPPVPYNTGDITISGNLSTRVEVVES